MIYLFYPNKTLTISLSGPFCPLNCKHCGGHYLKNMKDPQTAIEILRSDSKTPFHLRRYKSVLISGGSDKDGRIPIYSDIKLLKEIKKLGYKINLHAGFERKSVIFKVAHIVDKVSLDLVYDDEIIQEVYGLDLKKEDYINNYLLWRGVIGGVKGLESVFSSPFEKFNSTTVPHITIGLKGGEIKGEFELINELAYIKPALIVFLVFIPTEGTFYSDRKPPDLKDIERVFEAARRKLTRSNFFLGCMRPKGEYRETLDMLAYNYGFKGFVNPSKPLVDLLKKNNEAVSIYDECCVFF